MNRFLSKRNIFVLIVLLASLLLAIYFETRPRLAPGQKPLADITDIETLRTQFNGDDGYTRLVILVAPT